jgi:hypothetical protein
VVADVMTDDHDSPEVRSQREAAPTGYMSSRSNGAAADFVDIKRAAHGAAGPAFESRLERRAGHWSGYPGMSALT